MRKGNGMHFHWKCIVGQAKISFYATYYNLHILPNQLNQSIPPSPNAYLTLTQLTPSNL